MISELSPTSEDSLPATRLAPAEASEPFSLQTFLKLLRTNRRSILLSGLAGLVLATVVAFLLPPEYTATASFVPPGANTGSSSAAALMSQLSSIGGAGLLGSKSSGDLYVGLLKSQTVSLALVRRFNLGSVYKVKKLSQAQKHLAANSLFAADAKTSIVTISVTDKSPERARDLANGYLHALQETSANLAVTESSQRRLFYEQRLAREKEELANAEVALKQTEEKSGLIAPAGQTMSQIQSLAQLQAQVTEREVRLASLLHDEADENPDVLRLREEIGSLRSQIAQMEGGQRKSNYGFSAAQVPALELDYIRKARDVKYHESLFEIISKQYEAARLDEAKDAPLQVLDQAILPDTKSGPQRSIFMILGLLAGLVFGVVRGVAGVARVR